MKIIFIGTPQFGAIVLEGLVKTNCKPVLVITAPDKPVGRKQILKPSEVKLVARQNDISIIQPKRIKEALPEIKKINPDLIVSAAYGQIIPKEILDIPKHGNLNIHPSLLPKHRGPSPIQTAILNGDSKTGVSIYLMDEQVDHGKIIISGECPMGNMYYKELTEKLAELGLKLLKEIIPKIENNEIEPKAQNENEATHTKTIKKEDGRIDWTKPAEKIERHIRAFHVWPGSFTFWKKNNKKSLRLKILKAEVLKPMSNFIDPKPRPHSIGQIVQMPIEGEEKLHIKCGEDLLTIEELQLEGKNPLHYKDFLRGNPEFINAILK